MKQKVTKKYLKDNFVIINSGNGNLQNLLTFIEPDYYCSRSEGWACDAYIIGGYAILDGYDCIGKIKSHKLLEKYDKKAASILELYRSGSKYYTDNRVKSALKKLVYKLAEEVQNYDKL